MKKAIITTLFAAACATACMQNIEIPIPISGIDSEYAQLIDSHLPREVLIAVGERRLIPEPENGTSPISSAILPTSGGLKAISSNEAVARVERKDDGSFYVIGVTQGQATVSVSYLDYGKSFPVIVERTTINSITPPADYSDARVRDSIIFTYGIAPANASRKTVSVTSDSEGVRVWNDGTNIGVYAVSPCKATITVSAGDLIAETFSVKVDRVAGDSIHFEVPSGPDAGRIEDYPFDISDYATPIYEKPSEGEAGAISDPRLLATVYPGIPTDYYDKLYKPVPADTLVRHTASKFDFHVGVYPLNATDYICNLEIINVQFVAEYDGEYGRDGDLVKVDPAYWYKYFTFNENTGSGRFNDYSVTPHRPCIIRFKATAGGRTKQFMLDFRLDGDNESDFE